MDRLTSYRNTVQETIKKYYNLTNSQITNAKDTAISERLILDSERDQYLWLRCGWDGKKRVQHIILYLHIQNGKIWVEEDSTDMAIVDDLLAAGIPTTDIILGFHHPNKRALTEFAIT
ncbi:XisI protein [Calothrix sp. NIES-3974]|uniref:XisI protein n=1 Tax=Calothrix sp. NIES-3974 TaxID=2005462 RepID=UPI000B615528|nr:XisI protein [Calothrix sp. NIES-3974]BAZ06513.1 fdxN element excision controlling factor XisI homolog [Calothrix sp. NIES-3974]